MHRLSRNSASILFMIIRRLQTSNVTCHFQLHILKCSDVITFREANLACIQNYASMTDHSLHIDLILCINVFCVIEPLYFVRKTLLGILKY